MSKLQESGSATQTERRRSTRSPFGAVLKMEWGSAVIRGSVIDISAEGMRIEIADPLWVGAGFSAVLALEPPLRMECVVRRGRPGGGTGAFLVSPAADGPGRPSPFCLTLAKKYRTCSTIPHHPCPA